MGIKMRDESEEWIPYHDWNGCMQFQGDVEIHVGNGLLNKV